MATFIPGARATTASMRSPHGLLGSRIYQKKRQLLSTSSSIAAGKEKASTSAASSNNIPPRMGDGVEKVIRVVRNAKQPAEAATTKEAVVEASNNVNNNNSKRTFWQRFWEPKEMPPRHTLAWYREMVLICTVFAVTGSSTMVLVRMIYIYLLMDSSSDL
jgi:hypothetical protein